MIHAFHLTVLSTLPFVRLHRQQLQQRGFFHFSLDRHCAVLRLAEMTANYLKETFVCLENSDLNLRVTGVKTMQHFKFDVIENGSK